MDENVPFNLIQHFGGCGALPTQFSDDDIRDLAQSLGEPAYVFMPFNPKKRWKKQHAETTLWNVSVTKAEQGAHCAIDCGHIVGQDNETLLKMWDNAAKQLQRGYRCERVITLGESMGGFGIVNQAL